LSLSRHLAGALHREENDALAGDQICGFTVDGRGPEPVLRVNLSGAKLGGADLSGANLDKALLGEAELTGANLAGANLNGVILVGVNLSRADLSRVKLTLFTLDNALLREANLTEANLDKAFLIDADLTGANLTGASLDKALLIGADLTGANLSKADLTGANLAGAQLIDAHLIDARLIDADLRRAYLRAADLSGADLSGADLRGATLLDTDFTGADLTGCRIHGVSAWDLKLERTKQQNLVITRRDEPEITVDNIEVAQFIYLMLNNQKVRDVIDTITSKVVLILGRFTAERKGVLDALREELRKRDYLPILFDFAVPATRDTTETVSLLARMARFIIADLTDPSSIPKELETIVPQLAVPVQPLLEGASRPYAMFKDYWKFEWVLPVYRYEGLEPLLATLAENVIAPAERKVRALEERRRMIEAELTKPQ
jgi:uncharacterized protein YjbI with pentapeptide repeats